MTFEEDILISLIHAEMLFIRGICGPQGLKFPTYAECRDEMVECLTKAGEKFYSIFREIDTRRPVSGTLPAEFALCIGKKTYIPTYLMDEVTNKWAYLITGIVPNLYWLTLMYLNKAESLEKMYDLIRTDSFQKMLDLSYAFHVFYSKNPINSSPRTIFTNAQIWPIVSAWLSNAVPFNKNAKRTIITNCWKIPMDRLKMILPMVDLEEDKSRK